MKAISLPVSTSTGSTWPEDRQTFDQLQSAQLRIDMVQNQSLLPNYLDTMAWMSLAGLFPDKTGKLPPLQDLTAGPSTGGGSGKMNQMVLPGGSGQVAVNLSMTHKESMFYTVIKTLTDEVGRFSPLLGLPAISVTALKGFCSLYGALEQRTTFLLNSMPKPAYATQAARASAQTQAGLNLVPGDYVLVPNAYSAQLAPYLDKLEMRQGYLVPKGSPKTTSVYDLCCFLEARCHVSLCVSRAQAIRRSGARGVQIVGAGFAAGIPGRLVTGCQEVALRYTVKVRYDQANEAERVRTFGAGHRTAGATCKVQSVVREFEILKCG